MSGESGVNTSGSPRRAWIGVAVAVAVVAISLVLSAAYIRLFGRRLFEDGQVYLEGGRTWLHGGDLYSAELATPFHHFTLLFTYPPIAAVLFGLLGGLTIHHGIVVLVAVTFASLYLVGFLALREVLPRSGRLARVPAAALAVPVAALALLLEPVQQTVTFGQVNLALLALVAVDCLNPWRRWPRGVLIGLAAAIKLTPLAFLIYFVARRDWRGAATALGSFIVFGLIGFALAPHDSVEYWFHDLGNTGRIGNFWYTGNQSVRGMLPRLGLTPSAAGAVWAVIAVALAVTCWFAVRARTRADDRLGAVVATGLFALLVSPVSWTHHWVWVVPGLIWAIALTIRTGSQWLAVATTLAVVVFVVGPQWAMPTGDNVELRWTPTENLVGNAYVWIGIATLVAIAVVRPRRHGSEHTGAAPASKAPASASTGAPTAM